MDFVDENARGGVCGRRDLQMRSAGEQWRSRTGRCVHGLKQCVTVEERMAYSPRSERDRQSLEGKVSWGTPGVCNPGLHILSAEHRHINGRTAPGTAPHLTDSTSASAAVSHHQ